MLLLYKLQCIFLLATSNNVYDSDGSSSSGLPVGAIAGITIAGVLLFFIIGTFLMIGLIYIRHRYNRQSQIDHPTVEATAPYGFNPLPEYYANLPTADNHAFVGAPDEFSGYPPPTATQHQYAPGPQPTVPQSGGQIPKPQPQHYTGQPTEHPLHF